MPALTAVILLLFLFVGLLCAYAARRLLARRAATLRGARGESGQGLMEMAVMLPLFLILVLGVVEVASAMNTYITVVSSARDGARLASKGGADDATIKSLVVSESGRLRDAIDPSGDVTVEYVDIAGAEAVRVTVCNDHSLLLDVPLMLKNPYRMCSTTAMRVISPEKS